MEMHSATTSLLLFFEEALRSTPEVYNIFGFRGSLQVHDEIFTYFNFYYHVFSSVKSLLCVLQVEDNLHLKSYLRSSNYLFYFHCAENYLI